MGEPSTPFYHRKRRKRNCPFVHRPKVLGKYAHPHDVLKEVIVYPTRRDETLIRRYESQEKEVGI